MKTTKLFLHQTCSRHQNLLLLSLFCAGMLTVRIAASQSIVYTFLVWNLFLAGLPLAITTLISSRNDLFKKKLTFNTAVLCWLLLLPNAPYLITDFIHLHKRTGAPLWFDVLLLASFACTGLLLGLASMRQMQQLLSARFRRKAGSWPMIGVCLLSGYGVYLGRMLRYNSWDVLQRPLQLIADIFTHPFSKSTFGTAWGMTLGFGALFYLTFLLYTNPKEQ